MNRILTYGAALSLVATTGVRSAETDYQRSNVPEFPQISLQYKDGEGNVFVGYDLVNGPGLDVWAVHNHVKDTLLTAPGDVGDMAILAEGAYSLEDSVLVSGVEALMRGKALDEKD